MWRIINSFYLNNRFNPPDVKKCFFVGGNAGRKKPWRKSIKEVAKADKSAISGSIVGGVSGSALSTGSFGNY